ncbi:MAG: putative PEP-binding protein [Gammaproteobacteria bacterium]
MTRNDIHITGSAYFPGVAIARLHKGISGDIAQRILLISQHEVSSFSSLPAGFIVVESVPFSHTMIGLLGLGVPTVLVSAQQAELLEQDMRLVIDGSSGLISSNVDAVPAVVELRQKLEAGKPVMMADGEPVNLSASVRQSSIAGEAKALGAQAIGLVRTEFLIPDNDLLPDAAFYSRAFGEICKAASPLTVTFRLLDVAADKIPSWLPKLDIMGQALGLQGVRLFNIEPVQGVVSAQLAALAGLSTDFPVRVLLPFLVRVEEYDHWLSLIRKSLPDHVPVGAMAETPAMVLDIAELLNRADFVAIGCNDLMQSVYAADRDRSALRDYLDPYAPLLFRLFRQLAQQAGENLNNIQLCGVLAQISGVLPVLLGLGYRTFSVDAPFIPHLAQRVVDLTKADCESLAEQVCAVNTTQEVLEILQLPGDRHPPYSC